MDMDASIYRERAWLEVDLDALERNVRKCRSIIGADCALTAVVKSNAYGLGAVPVARALTAAGVDMLAVACLLLYLAIVKGFEPLLLLPIAFGMLLSNLPMGGLMSDPVYKVFTSAEKAAQYGAYYGKSVEVVLNSSGKEVYQVLYQNGGLLL